MFRSITPIGRGRLPGLLLLAGICWLVAYPAVATALTINRAEWNAPRSHLRVNVSVDVPVDAGTSVSLSNANDVTQVLGSRAFSGSGTWRARIRRPVPVPCRVRADSAGQSAELDVQGAPADCAPKGPGTLNVPPTANANGPYEGTVGRPVTFDSSGSADTDGTIVSYEWDFGDGGTSAVADPNHTYATTGSYSVSLRVTDDDGASASDTTTAAITEIGACPDFDPSAVPGASINSSSQIAECQNLDMVAEQPQVPNTDYSVLAINDLGMHCGDYDTRIASILPPFQVLLAQVIQKGGDPTLNPPGVDLFYSAASNPNDPNAGPASSLPGLMADGSTYKTNFWDTVALGAYDPFYPGGLGITPLATGAFPTTPDQGLPVPNLEDLYIGPDGEVNSGDESLTAVQHAMPGMTNPYVVNAPQKAQEHYEDKPFFVNFPFGYVANAVNWYEGAGVPFAAFDDFGRENAYPLVRVQAKRADTVLSTVDTVLPISGEASCTNCHTTNDDYISVHSVANRTDIPTGALDTAGLPVATSLDDPDSNMPLKVSLEYAADINILRLHDLRHGERYVNTDCDNVPEGENCLETETAADPCVIPDTDPSNPNPENGSVSCLTNKALRQEEPEPVVCQVCHYTPALDLAHVGPMAGAPGTDANGRNQLAHQSNSRVMHNHHGAIAVNDRNGNPMFPAILPPDQDASGAITNQTTRLAQLEDSCYQCHPGKNVQCLRGAMFNADMLCSDCHGSMNQVGNDFSEGVSPSNPGDFKLTGLGNFYNPADPQPRVPWANEPGCGSCHTGDANNNLTSLSGTLANSLDTYGNTDGIRLRQAFRTGDPKATPIVPTNKRFAEPEVPASFGGFANPGAGNPKLYRVSTGHGGVMCEGCHGATHAEWPNANPFANDNLMAKQLQRHTGSLTECSACHTTSQLPSNTQGGPHGMHLVNDIRFWKEGHKDAAKRQNGQPGAGTCGACHGSDHRGTVLARAPVARVFTVESSQRRVEAGEPVACDLCHSLNKSFGR